MYLFLFEMLLKVCSFIVELSLVEDLVNRSCLLVEILTLISEKVHCLNCGEASDNDTCILCTLCSRQLVCYFVVYRCGSNPWLAGNM